MGNIVLTKKSYHKFHFHIANAVIRTDGRYCDCTLTFETSQRSNPEETSGIIGMQILSSNMQSLETILYNLADIFPPVRERNVPVIDNNNVLKNRIGKLAFKTAHKQANSPIQPQKES